jgi:hypothetical protein
VPAVNNVVTPIRGTNAADAAKKQVSRSSFMLTHASERPLPLLLVMRL